MFYIESKIMICFERILSFNLNMHEDNYLFYDFEYPAEKYLKKSIIYLIFTIGVIHILLHLLLCVRNMKYFQKPCT